MTRVATAELLTGAPMSWTMEEVIAAVGGTPAALASARYDSISTDSRQIGAHALFVALRGPRHDGHDHIVEAFARGARAAIVDREVPGVDPTKLIRVADTLAALGDLAAWTRAQYAIPVVAVTGSNGKTTTKEMIAAICAAAPWPADRAAVLKTEGNYNNLIGLPLTVFGLRRDHAVAVLELGMNRPGEIARLTAIARPTYALITNVGPAHLEGVGGTLAGVAAAKGELFAGVPPDATLAVNADDAWVARLASGFRGRQIVFGRDAAVHASDCTDSDGGTAFTLHLDGRSLRVQLPLLGRHNVRNAVAAAAVTHAMGIPAAAIGRGLAGSSIPHMRLQAVRLANGVMLLNDAYNANPSSMEAALETLRRFPGRAVVVLGDMRELGDEAGRAHRAIGARAAAFGVRQLVSLGEWATAMAEGARAGGLPSAAITVCRTHAEAAAAVVAQWQRGDTVLVKGSRGMRMEEVVRLLESAGSAP